MKKILLIAVVLLLVAGCQSKEAYTTEVKSYFTKTRAIWKQCSNDVDTLVRDPSRWADDTFIVSAKSSWDELTNLNNKMMAVRPPRDYRELHDLVKGMAQELKAMAEDQKLFLDTRQTVHAERASAHGKEWLKMADVFVKTASAHGKEWLKMADVFVKTLGGSSTP